MADTDTTPLGIIVFWEFEKGKAEIVQWRAEQKAKKNNSLASKLAFKVVSGKQEKGGIYDDIIWGILPSEYVLVVGQRTEAEVLPYEQVKSRLIADYHQLKEQEYVNTLREKYNPKVVSKLK